MERFREKSPRGRAKQYKAYLYLAPSLVLMAVFVLYPLIKAIWMSFCEGYNVISGTYAGINFENYRVLFSDKVFLKSLVNTSLYVVFVVPLSILLSLLISVLIYNTKRCKALFQTLYFLPYVTSVIAIGIVWSWIFNSHYGLMNSFLGLLGIDPIPWLNDPRYALPALIIFSIWKSLAFNIMIFLSGLSSISEDIYQAARIDATPRWRVFWRITVPQLRPIIIFALIMGMINAFKVYNEVFSLFQGSAGPAGSAMTVVYYIYDTFYNSYNYSLAAAAAVVLFGIILTLTLLQRRISGKKDTV